MLATSTRRLPNVFQAEFAYQMGYSVSFPPGTLSRCDGMSQLVDLALSSSFLIARSLLPSSALVC